MKLFAAVMPLFVVGISMVHYHQTMDELDKDLETFKSLGLSGVTV